MFLQTQIRCIITGGTIDNRYHQRLGKMVIGNNVEKMLKDFRLPHHQIITERLFKVDSRNMTQDHRSQIITAVRKSKENKVIITHGTDTIVKTARYLRENLSALEKKKKVVVLTGAMVPYGVMGGTPSGQRKDAKANLISAIAMLEVLSSDVWIAFHGRKINPLRAYKDYSQLTLWEK